MRQEDVFIAKFEKQSLYKIVDGKVIWKIATLNEREVQAGCDIILENEYLKGKFLMISNNIEQPYMYIGLKFVIPSDFPTFDFYTITITLLSVIAISLLIVFIVLNNSLNKMIEKEEQKFAEEEEVAN